jgi:Asp-tRNA(Asn)/Glu-tRNA(Gln) amidotransferase A subunit family amidase
MLTGVLERSACEQAPLARAGEVRAGELAEATLDGIEHLNPTVNAFVTVCGERALAEADTVGARDPASAVRRTGRDQGSPVRHRRSPDQGGQPRLARLDRQL